MRPNYAFFRMKQLKITKSITNRESASLDKYLQEIGREDLIVVEEEVELAQRIRIPVGTDAFLDDFYEISHTLQLRLFDNYSKKRHKSRVCVYPNLKCVTAVRFM